MVLSRIQSIIPKKALKIIPDVYQLTIATVNVVIIVENELTLVDTAFRGNSAQIVDFIHGLGRSVEEVSLIIITHNHLDHVGGLVELRRLTGAKVAAHQADIVYAEGQPSYPRVVQKALQTRPLSALRSVLAVDASEVDIQLEGSEVLKPLGGLRVVYTPGHTPGSISLFSPVKKMLIVGDALDRCGRGILPPHKMISTDMRQAVDSIREIARLDFDILCFGHGRPFIGDAHAKVQRLMDKIRIDNRRQK